MHLSTKCEPDTHTGLCGVWLYSLINREGTSKHEEHEADGPSKGEADESWKRDRQRVVTAVHVRNHGPSTLSSHGGSTECTGGRQQGPRRLLLQLSCDESADFTCNSSISCLSHAIMGAVKPRTVTVVAC